MVHFTQSSSTSLFHSTIVVYESLRTGYPIRLSRPQRMFAPPPGFSQLTTAFFALQLLGIHHKPIFAWPYYLSCFTFFHPRSVKRLHAKSCIFLDSGERKASFLRNFLIRISTDAGSLFVPSLRLILPLGRTRRSAITLLSSFPDYVLDQLLHLYF